MPKEIELELDPQRWENLIRKRGRGGYYQEGGRGEQTPGNRSELFTSAA